jgi:hypothetical protein
VFGLIDRAHPTSAESVSQAVLTEHDWRSVGCHDLRERDGDGELGLFHHSHKGGIGLDISFGSRYVEPDRPGTGINHEVESADSRVASQTARQVGADLFEYQMRQLPAQK